MLKINLVLHIAWKILDLIAVGFSLLGIIFFPLCLLLLVSAVLTSPIQNIVSQILPMLTIMFSGLGAAIGTASLLIVTLIAPQKICKKKLHLVMVIAGLVIGIIAAIFYMKGGWKALSIGVVDIIWICSYMMVSAVAHIAELLRARAKNSVQT